MADVFLSYNRDDQAVARRFAEAFAAHGFDVWWDTALRSGEAYDQVTEKALREAKAVVVLWSKRSVESRWCRAEATLADRARTLVPAMIEPCERPIMFELTQTAELSHWKGETDDRAWLAFVADVKRFLERGPRPAAAAAPVKAIPTLEEIAAEPPKPVETLLAVLPFDNLSSDAEMQFFSDGVSEDILGRIQRGSKLKVIGKTSSFQFRGPDKPRAAAALKATHIVDGSIRRSGTKVRIAAQLTEAAGRHTLWSDKYDRNLDDIFAVQDEISEAIATALDTAFFAKKTAALDPAVYDLYLRSGALIVDPAEMARNLVTLETVTKLAPDFADGWGRLALLAAVVSMYQPYAERGPLHARADAALARTLALDPENGQAMSAQSLRLAPFGTYLEQETVAQRARKIAMNSAQNMFDVGWLMSCVGRYREALQFARRAYELDPKNAVISTQRAQVLWHLGRYAEGIAAMEAHAEAWPDDHHGAVSRIIAYAHQHDWEKLDAILSPQRLGQYPLREYSLVIGLVALMRSADPAGLVLENLRQRAAKSGHVTPDNVLWPAVMGFADEAFDVLDSVKLGPSGGPDDMLGVSAYRPQMLFTAAFPELRNNPRFVKLCARLGLVEYWLGTGTWPDCVDDVPYDFRAECEKLRDYPKDVFFAPAG